MEIVKIINASFNASESQIILESRIEWHYAMLGVFLFFIVIVTIIGNVMVLIAITKDKRLRTSFNWYIVNLAITDVSVAVTAMSFYTVNNILGYWPFGEFMCGVWIFFDYGMTFASVFTLILISLDRFWSVTWSVHYKRYHSKRTSLIFIALSWLFMLCLWLPPCITDRLKNSQPGECKWEPSQNRGFVIIVATIGHHGSCFILLFCYMKVFLFMRKRIKQAKTGVELVHVSTISQSGTTHADDTRPTISDYIVDSPGGQMISVTPAPSGNTLEVPRFKPHSLKKERAHVPCPMDSLPKVEIPDNGDISIVASDAASGSKIESISDSNTSKHVQRQSRKKASQISLKLTKIARTKKDRKVFVTLTYIVAGYMICWVPFHVVFDISAIDPNLVPEVVYTITFWMTYINSTINPFLYNFASAEFRHAFKKMICLCK